MSRDLSLIGLRLRSIFKPLGFLAAAYVVRCLYTYCNHIGVYQALDLWDNTSIHPKYT